MAQVADPSTSEAGERLLTVREACERLALSKAKVYRLLAEGELASVHIGKSRRIPASELEAFIARHVEEVSGR